VTANHTSPTPYRSFLTLATVILTVAALYWAQKVLIPLALAVLLAFILSPAVSLLQRRGLGRISSVCLVVVFAFFVLGGITAVVALQIRDLAAELPHRKHQIAQRISSVVAMGKGTILESIQTTIQEITHEVLETQNSAGKEAAADNAKTDHSVPVEVVNSTNPAFQALRVAVEPAAEFLALAVLVVVLVIFILIRREDLRNRLVRLLGHGRLLLTTRALDEAATRISRYLLMQVLINACFGAALSLGLFVIGVPYALLWGFLAGGLRFVPYAGTWLGGGLLLVYTLAIAEQGWTQLLEVAGVFLVLELLTANVAEPFLFGRSTGISSVALLVAAAFWTWLWGPIGLVLSTPLTACVVVLGKFVPQLQFFNILLGDEPVLEAEESYYQRLLAHDQDEAEDLIEKHLQSHSLVSVYDEVLIPSLVLAKKDRERGELSAEDEEFILRVTRDLLNDQVQPQPEGSHDRDKDRQSVENEEAKVLAFGCAARDAFDELGIVMVQQILESSESRLEILSSEMLSGELIGRVKQEQPAVVCVGALPPGGLSQTRYLCKRLRRCGADVKIVIGYWGLTDNVARVKDRLLAAGADGVATTLAETQHIMLPMLQLANHVRAQRGSNKVAV
jgi:predicted PurR-regulated permease PerM